MTPAAWLGAALALLVMFVIGVFTGMSAAHLGRIDCDDTPGRAEFWRAKVFKNAEAILELDKEIKALHAERKTAQAKAIKLGGKLAWLESQLSSEQRHRRDMGRRFCLDGIKAEQTEGAAIEGAAIEAAAELGEALALVGADELPEDAGAADEADDKRSERDDAHIARRCGRIDRLVNP